MPPPVQPPRRPFHQPHHLLLGLLTLIPSALFALLLGLLLTVFYAVPLPIDPGSTLAKPFGPVEIHVLSLVGLKAGLLCLALYYTLDVVRSDRVAQDRKGFWVVGFFLLGFLVMPRYWWKHIRQLKNP